MSTSEENNSVTVEASARLHLGFIDPLGGSGRRYGSLGVAIRRPIVSINVERIKRGIAVKGPSKQRVRDLVGIFKKHFRYSGGVRVTVREVIPEHIGLGSGTQLSLSIGAAIATLLEKEVNIQELARVAGRGEVSGIGTATFERGGFVIDGGIPVPTDDEAAALLEGYVPPLLFRYDVPEDWVFVVALPNLPRGFSGVAEEQAFSKMPPAQTEQSNEIGRYVLMQLLPALVEGDILRFGAALTTIQRLVGDCFATAQGGRFADPVIATCITAMLEAGAFGAGQSSWGPACYALARWTTGLKAIRQAVSRVLDATCGGTIIAARANNHGALIKGPKER
ncbi:MAG: beta-ribofuranosylaminobenzene 5'-phosphate synthase family protein [Promethearchaeota archaeon]